MIGQHNLQSRIEQLIQNRTFPRFSIFVGPAGSGKKTFARELRNKFNNWRVISDYVNVYQLPDVKIDTIRTMIGQSYKNVYTTLYIIADADNMSSAAKNALLKVVEEPPNEAYFIMTLEDETNTLDTIRSRATVFRMDRYTPNEISCYCFDKYQLDKEEELIVSDICETPGEVDILVKSGIQEFYDYVQLVVDNIAEVSLANAFKIPSKVALKEDAEGYDLRLFWKAFMKILVDGNKKHDFMAIVITSKYLQKLRIRGINKQMLVDNWLLEIRELWMN